MAPGAISRSVAFPPVSSSPRSMSMPRNGRFGHRDVSMTTRQSFLTKSMLRKRLMSSASRQASEFQKVGLKCTCSERDAGKTGGIHSQGSGKPNHRRHGATSRGFNGEMPPERFSSSSAGCSNPQGNPSELSSAESRGSSCCQTPWNIPFGTHSTGFPHAPPHVASTSWENTKREKDFSPASEVDRLQSWSDSPSDIPPSRFSPNPTQRHPMDFRSQRADPSVGFGSGLTFPHIGHSHGPPFAEPWQHIHQHPDFSGVTDVLWSEWSPAPSASPVEWPTEPSYFCSKRWDPDLEDSAKAVNADEDLLATDAHYRTALESDPANPLLLRNYARFLFEVKCDCDEAESYYKKAIALAPGDGELLVQYAKLLWEARCDSVGAAAVFERAVNAAPQDCFVLAAYASFLWNSDGTTEKNSSVVAPPFLPAAPGVV
eukprot:TRINITY_DN20916_c0_g1_i1.p1 TRINITY_DN20916_c0_g1~~TRINITY_DN20916_c0_g1_i1.p1  ORF type:complete len:430 (+),score=-1.99 TRINITY_DN20916_c0_g1_i1:352-1641(+)